MAAPPTTSTNALLLPASSGWVSASFALDAASLTQSSGIETLDAVLASVGALSMRHDPSPLDPPGTQNPTTGTLGIDDITAIPEGSTALLLAAGLTGLAARRRPHRLR